jgi:uncharacterized membrane protein YphA (DoxX/SURF4 family)
MATVVAATRVNAEIESARLALRIATLGIGIFFLFMSLNKVSWLANPDLLAQRFERWLPNAAWHAQVYLGGVAIPGAPLFARVVPVGELCAALAMLSGRCTRVAAIAALFMILNFHLATSSFSSIEFLRDGTGPPMFAALLAVALTKGPLPLSVRRNKDLK